MSDNVFSASFPSGMQGMPYFSPPDYGPSYVQEKRQSTPGLTVTELGPEDLAFPPPAQRSNERFSCPYRKRNPWRFNVREHPTCANHSFSTFALLKQVHLRHVQTKHQSKDFAFPCSNCGISFRTDADRLEHQESELCFRHCTDEHDNGITEDMLRRLRDRGARNGVSDWNTLWMTIFPGSDPLDIPSHEFTPVVEAHETWYHFFQRLREHSCCMTVEGMRQIAGAHLDTLVHHGQDFLLVLGNTIRSIGRIIWSVAQRQGARARWLDEALRFSMSR